MSENLGAWHGSQELKDRIVARMKAHRKADDFIQGMYQEIFPDSALGYRGCAIGCALDKQPVRQLAGHCECGMCPTEDNEPAAGWHYEFEDQFGIPSDVAELIDNRYEELRAPAHAAFAVDALEAIPVGADLSGVWQAFYANGRVHSREHDAAFLLRLLAGERVTTEASHA